MIYSLWKKTWFRMFLNLCILLTAITLTFCISRSYFNSKDTSTIILLEDQFKASSSDSLTPQTDGVYTPDAIAELDRLCALFVDAAYTSDTPGGIAPNGWRTLKYTLQALDSWDPGAYNGRLHTLQELAWLYTYPCETLTSIGLENGDQLLYLQPLSLYYDLTDTLQQQADHLSKELSLVTNSKDTIIFAVIAEEPELYADLLHSFYFGGGEPPFTVSYTPESLFIRDILARYSK